MNVKYWPVCGLDLCLVCTEMSASYRATPIHCTELQFSTLNISRFRFTEAAGVFLTFYYNMNLSIKYSVNSLNATTMLKMKYWCKQHQHKI